MLEKLVMPLVIGFVVRQLEKFEESIDWERVKADTFERVRMLVPGTWFDDEACAIAGAAIDIIKSVLSKGSDVKHLLQLLSDKKYDMATSMLKELVLGKLMFPVAPLTAAECKVKSCLIK